MDLLVIFLACLTAGAVVLGLIASVRTRELRRRLLEQERLAGRLSRQIESLRSGGTAMPSAGEQPQRSRPAPGPTSQAVPASAVDSDRVAPTGEVAPGPVVEERIQADRGALRSGSGVGTLEEAAGKRWMTFGGVLILFLAAVFFVKYAFDQRWFGPKARVILGVGFGLLLLSLGEVAIRRRMPALGKGLMGGGFATLHVALFAGFSLYELYGPTAAFVGFVLVTVNGMVLAVRHASLALAFLAVLGGLLTPIFIPAVGEQRDGLFAYILLLDLGVLGVALFRRWRALELLAAAGTWIHFANWYLRHDHGQERVAALIWLSLFFLVFLLLPVLSAIRLGVSLTLDRFLMLVSHSGIAYGFGYSILIDLSRRHAGSWAAGMALCFGVMALLLRRFLPSDRLARSTYLVFGMAALTPAVALLCAEREILLGWTIQSLLLVWLGCRYQQRPVRVFAFLVLVLSCLRLFSAAWPLHPHGIEFRPFFNAELLRALSPALAAFLFFWILRRLGEGASQMDRWLRDLALLGGGWLALVLLHIELGEWLRESDRRNGLQQAQVLLWSVGMVGLVLGGIGLRVPLLRIGGLLPFLVALIHVGGGYALERPGHWPMLLNARFAVALVAVGSLSLCAWQVLRAGERCLAEERAPARFLLATAGLLLLGLFSVEVYQHVLVASQGGDRLARLSVSVVWGLYAAALLAIGFFRRIRELRIAALVLFGLTAFKLVLLDIAGVDPLHRIGALLLVGALMIGAAYVYHRVENALRESDRGRGER